MAQLIVYYSRRGKLRQRLHPDPGGGQHRSGGPAAPGPHRGRPLPVGAHAPYSDDYNECIQQAQDDQRRDARPALKACPETLDPYDTIYLGYPNYWGTMPMCVFTFFGTVRFHRQDHPPFCTHEGSGLGHSEADIRRLCHGAKVGKGLAIHGTAVCREERALEAWIKGGN